MVAKSYLRYVAGPTLGLVVGNESNVQVWGDERQLVVAPALENVILWDMRKAEAVATLKGEKHAVTCVRCSPDKVHIAAGYKDGQVRLWEASTGLCHVVFNGHRSAVAVAVYDNSGLLLATGGADCDIIVWDVVAERGLYRLRGHRGPVTSLVFLVGQNMLLSSSSDGTVKAWDLTNQHCAHTLTGFRSEVCAMALDSTQTRLVCGTAERELMVWAVVPADDSAANENEDPRPQSSLSFKLIGGIPRQSIERVVTIDVHHASSLFAVQGADKTVEIFRFRTIEEAKKKMKRRAKRQREKAAKEKDEGEASAQPISTEPCATDEIEPLHTLSLSAKASAVLWTNRIAAAKGVSNAIEADLVVALRNNTLEQYSVVVGGKECAATRQRVVERGGHRSAVKALALSHDDKLLASACSRLVKLWSMTSNQCLRTFSVDGAISLAFVPGDRHLLVGTKKGRLQLHDLGPGTASQDTAAHSGAIMSIGLRGDKRGFATGSADKDVKLWEYDLLDQADHPAGAKQLGYVHTTTMKMSDDVLCVKYTPDMRLLAVALLDCTVKIFFADSLKFFTSLYGHKLPVLSLDISSDSTLLATASADKNIKFWGLDFGDCHRSIYAHSDSITSLSFVADTHYLLTTSKDKTVKYWDGDTHTHILTLQGHEAEVWCGVASRHGHVFVSASSDRSIRMWERIDEQVILSEEVDAEREAQQDEELIKESYHDKAAADNTAEALSATKKTIESMKGADSIIEAIQLADEESAARSQWERDCDVVRKSQRNSHKTISLPPPPPPNIIMTYLKIDTPARYVLYVIQKIHPSQLDEALLVLPFHVACRLLAYIDEWFQAGLSTELACHCLFYLLRVHHSQIVSTQALLPVLASLRSSAGSCVLNWKDMIGQNLAGLQQLKAQLEAKNVHFFDEARKDVRERARKKKRVVLVG